MAFSWFDNSRVLVIAHRGAPALGAENTRDGFAAALAAGSDAIETDVRLTADGEAVCIHDADLLRIAGVAQRVDRLALENLRRLYPPALTLQDAIAASAGAGLLLDIKTSDSAMLNALTDALASTPEGGRILAGARMPAMAQELRKRIPRIPLLAFSSSPDDAAQWRDSGADWFRLWEPDATQTRIAAARAIGLRIAVMTGDWRPPESRRINRSVGDIDDAALAHLLEFAPDAILLDDPRLLTSFVTRL